MDSRNLECRAGSGFGFRGGGKGVHEANVAGLHPPLGVEDCWGCNDNVGIFRSLLEKRLDSGGRAEKTWIETTVVSKVRSEPPVRQRVVVCGHMLTTKKEIVPTAEARRISNDALT